MRSLLASLLAVALLGTYQQSAGPSGAQNPVTRYGYSDPSGVCSPDSGFYVNTTSGKLWGCPVSSWVNYSGSASTGVPAGSILIVDTGTCPASYTEVSALNGKTLVGTLAAGGNVGGTGGSDNITPQGTNGTVSFTPAGTNGTVSFTPSGTNGTVNFTPAGTNSAPGFTGSGWTPPAISWPAGVPTGATSGAGSAHTHGAGTFANVATATSGNCAATNIAAGTGSTTACKATAPNLTVPAQTHTGALANESAHTHAAGAISWPAGVPTIAAYTPAGTVAAPTFTGSQGTVPAQTFTGSSGTVPAQTFTGSAGTVPAQAFTGTQFDNRSAFTRVIFCKKD